MRDMTAKRAVVVGAGFGGLALAIRLQRAGVQVTLVEKRDKPGGRAYVWHEEGFTFDAGPTVITDPACLQELFEDTGSELKDYIDLMPVDPFYRLCWEDGASFDYNDDQEAMERQISAFNPADMASSRRSRSPTPIPPTRSPAASKTGPPFRRSSTTISGCTKAP